MYAAAVTKRVEEAEGYEGTGTDYDAYSVTSGQYLNIV
jgi:hypothetical protein